MKNINKRTLALMLAVALVFALAGCAATNLNLDELYDDVMALQVSVNEYAAAKGVEVDEVEAITLDEEALLPYVQFYDLYAVVQEDEVDTEADADDEVEAEAENEDVAEIESPYVDVVDVYDEAVILAITVDDSDIDVTTTGNYEIVYTVVVELDGLEYEVVITKTIHIVTAEEYDSLIESGEIAETDVGVAISTVVEVSTADSTGGADTIATTTVGNGETTDSGDAAQDTTSDTANSSTGDSVDTTATAKPSATSTPTATEKPSTSTTVTATATPKPTATAKPSTSGTTTATATPKPTATAKPSTGGTTTTATATPVPTANHTHSYTATVTTAATCTTAGVRTYTCSCGASYTETIPATGHSWVTETVSDGYYETVTVVDQEAYTEYIAGYWQCLMCYATFSSETAFMLHNQESHNWAAACTKIASQTIYHDAETHTEQNWIDTSYTVTKCSVCGTTK